MPDITGKLHGAKSYIEIVLKEEDRKSLISKLKLFCIMANRKGENFYLLVVKGQKIFADRIIKGYDLYNESCKYLIVVSSSLT